MWTIKKTYKTSGDCYAEIRFNGRLILTTLWLGESDEQLIGQAKAYKSAKGL